MKICEFCQTKNNDINTFCTNCKKAFTDIKQTPRENLNDLSKLPLYAKIVIFLICLMFVFALLQKAKDKRRTAIREWGRQVLIEDINKNQVPAAELVAKEKKKYNFDNVILPDDPDNKK